MHHCTCGVVIVSAFTVTSCFIVCVSCCICIWYLIHNVITVPPVAAVICKPPSDSKWPTGRPYHTWLRDQWIWSETAEYWSFLCTEDGNIPRTCTYSWDAHGYAQENRDTVTPHFLSKKTLQPTTLLYINTPLPSNRHHRSCGDCMEGKGENYQVCSVQYCVQQLCTVRCTHIWTD